MDLEQFKELKIPKEQKDKDRVLSDALQTENPLLIHFALAIGANPLKGGKKLLAYAVQQENLELAKKLVPVIAGGATLAMEHAISYDKIQIATWLSEEGVVMQIDRECISKHSSTVQYLLQHNPKAKANIQYEALEGAVTLNSNAEEVLETLLNFMKKNCHKDFDKWIVRLADYTVDTDRVDCMELMKKNGLDLRSVNTKYYSLSMKKYLEANGIKVSF